MLKRLFVVFGGVLLGFACLSMEMGDIFQSTVSKHASSSSLRTELEKIRHKSKEAELFVRKYYEKDDDASDNFEIQTLERVEKAAGYVASRLYEKGRKDPTNTELLEKALSFVKKGRTKIDSFDNRSESGMNTIASLRDEIQNLYNLRKNYNDSIDSQEFQGFLKGLSDVLKK